MRMYLLLGIVTLILLWFELIHVHKALDNC